MSDRYGHFTDLSFLSSLELIPALLGPATIRNADTLQVLYDPRNEHGMTKSILKGAAGPERLAMVRLRPLPLTPTGPDLSRRSSMQRAGLDTGFLSVAARNHPPVCSHSSRFSARIG